MAAVRLGISSRTVQTLVAAEEYHLALREAALSADKWVISPVAAQRTAQPMDVYLTKREVEGTLVAAVAAVVVVAVAKMLHPC